MPSQFKFKAALLTYSQVDNDTAAAFLSPKEAHFNHVASALRPPVVYRLGRELHEDGGTHFHVFVSFDQRVSFRNERTLDFYSSHPNIKPIPRTPHLAFDYAGKDDDVIYEYGDRPGESGASSSGRERIYGDALSAETKEGFLDIVRQGLQEITCFILEQSPDLQTRTTLPRRPLILRRPLRRTESGESLTGMVNQASEESWDEDA